MLHPAFGGSVLTVLFSWAEDAIVSCDSAKIFRATRSLSVWDWSQVLFHELLPRRAINSQYNQEMDFLFFFVFMS